MRPELFWYQNQSKYLQEKKPIDAITVACMQKFSLSRSQSNVTIKKQNKLYHDQEEFWIIYGWFNFQKNNPCNSPLHINKL